jgi:hypothetical protein
MKDWSFQEEFDEAAFEVLLDVKLRAPGGQPSRQIVNQVQAEDYKSRAPTLGRWLL